MAIRCCVVPESAMIFRVTPVSSILLLPPELHSKIILQVRARRGRSLWNFPFKRSAAVMKARNMSLLVTLVTVFVGVLTCLVR